VGGINRASKHCREGAKRTAGKSPKRGGEEVFRQEKWEEKEERAKDAVARGKSLRD